MFPCGIFFTKAVLYARKFWNVEASSRQQRSFCNDGNTPRCGVPIFLSNLPGERSSGGTTVRTSGLLLRMQVFLRSVSLVWCFYHRYQCPVIEKKCNDICSFVIAHFDTLWWLVSLEFNGVFFYIDMLSSKWKYTFHPLNSWNTVAASYRND